MTESVLSEVGGEELGGRINMDGLILSETEGGLYVHLKLYKKINTKEKGKKFVKQGKKEAKES